MPPGNPLIPPVNQVYTPPKPKLPAYNPFANIGVEGSGFATRNDLPPPPPPAPAAPPPPPAPIDWEAQVRNDPEGALQHTYLERQNTLTTDALRKAWLQHTQSTQDSFNSHGGLFSGAAAQADANAGADYKKQVEQQKLTFDQGGHDINTSVLHRLMLQLTGVDNGLGK